jgi:hypothetical protein
MSADRTSRNGNQKLRVKLVFTFAVLALLLLNGSINDLILRTQSIKFSWRDFQAEIATRPNQEPRPRAIIQAVEGTAEGKSLAKGAT